MKEKLLEMLRGMKREQKIVWLLLAALLVVVLLPTGKQKEETDQEEEKRTETADRQALSEENAKEALERVLAQVEGVGAVQIALTWESTNRKIVEKDMPNAQSSEKRTSADESSETSSVTKEETTVYEKNGGDETPYVISEVFPKVRGVVIVAEGGGNPVIVKEIQEAVMALFDVEAHRIKVMKMRG